MNRIDDLENYSIQNPLTEEQNDLLLYSIRAVTESSEDWKDEYANNFNDDMVQVVKEEDGDFASMAFVGALAIVAIISKIIKWIYNYKLRVKKLYDQTKELNDIYTKVADMLAHDKIARFKHRNDIVDAEIEEILLINNKTQKTYQFVYDALAYNADYYVNELNNKITYIETITDKKQKSEAITNATRSILDQIQDYFMENHGFVITHTPIMKKTQFKKQKLESCLRAYKSWIEFIYNGVYTLNKVVAAQLQYLQLLQQAYKSMINKNGKDKEIKEMIDNVFKQLIKNSTLSMDYNSKATTILEEMARFYLQELNTVYDIIRS